MLIRHSDTLGRVWMQYLEGGKQLGKVIVALEDRP
ncbi:hypothetical protein C4J88_2148 [Pseudomonas sp. R4-39-08]|nr:hypothetical protein C4J88_2148 [Pseudomonas sp. R4-39-08]